jgi:hypothetical protein
MYWYIKSKVFIESVINLSVCEADEFIDALVQRELKGNRSETIYQILDEETPMTFSSLQRMLLDYLQPSAVQLLGNLNHCIRRCFHSSGSHVAAPPPTLVPTILRSSQSLNDSDDDSSPRLASKTKKPLASFNDPQTTAKEIAPHVVSSSECPAIPLCADEDQAVAALNISNSCREPQITSVCAVEPQTASLCVVEYSAAIQRRWLAPSIIPHCLRLPNGLVSHVSGVAKSNDCHEYMFYPVVLLPDSRDDPIVSFSKARMTLTDSKGKQLDSRELDCCKMDLGWSTAQKSSNFIKNQVFRCTGHSIKVRQYFLQIERSMLADTYVLWWYMHDSGRSVCSHLTPHSLLAIVLVTVSSGSLCPTYQNTAKGWSSSGGALSMPAPTRFLCCRSCREKSGRLTFCRWFNGT